MGLETDGQLRQLRRPGGQRLEPPAHGILISEVLAAALQAQVGERIEVEVLEGDRRRTQVLVAGLTNELVGTTAWMESGALAQLTGEAVTSGALLLADPRLVDSLYRTLKRTPAVSGVAVREVQLRGFEETIAESFNISLAMMLGFAVVIAFGIVYNSARVALSERGRELASLRVLGFTRREVSAMLLGEQAVLGIASLPVSFAVAWTLCWLVAVRFTSEMFRIPVVIEGSSYLFGVLVIGFAGVLSAIAISRRIGQLDLVEVLKTRE
jgi:putative ABC transport system permease protein